MIEKIRKFKDYLLPAAVTLLLVLLMGRGYYDNINKPYIGFVLNSDFEIISITPGSPAEKAGFRVGDHVVKVNGETVFNKGAITRFGRTFSPGSILKYDIVRNNKTIRNIQLVCENPPPSDKHHILFNTLTAFTVLIIAAVMVFRKPELPVAHIFFNLCAAYVFFRMSHPRWQTEIMARIYQNIYLFFFFLLPAVFLHFCSRFPQDNRFFYKRHGRIFWVYSFPIIISLPAMVVNWIHHENIKSIHIITQLILLQGALVWGIYLTIGVLIMMKGYIHLKSGMLVKRCSIVFYTLFIAVLPYLTMGLFDALGKSSPFKGGLISMLLFIPFPLSLAWAIDLLDDKLS